LHQIGSGGHSVVNLAIRKSDNKKVVAKTIQCVSVWHWHTDEKTGADDLPLEVHMLQKFDKLNYPGIIKYYDHFDLATKFVIIMEYLGQDWMDLYDYIEHFGPVRERDANEIFSRVVSIVCHLHNAGYCHNDIKDENIMINARTRQIKLIDFGSLTYLNSGVTHNTFYGTRKFQSPEAIKGTYLLEYQEVWALGTLYYVMLFKMDPFKNDTEVLEVDIKRRMDRIRHFGVDGMIIDISDEAVLSISKMLDRDWTKRPAVSEILSLPAFKKQ
jgi:protein-serine/threonine kinase